MTEQVVLVDEFDNTIGVEEKLRAHHDSKLHRAFSVFVFDQEDNLLLQRRAIHKYHSGGLWSNTCCGHPRPEEGVKDAAFRRLQEEMGIQCSLVKTFDFLYRAVVGNGITEHEFDHVFVGFYDDAVSPNAEEVSDYRWLDQQTIKNEMTWKPYIYTAWFRMSFPQAVMSAGLLRRQTALNLK